MTHADIAKLRVVDLKAKLATFNLPTHGKKRIAFFFFLRLSVNLVYIWMC